MTTLVKARKVKHPKQKPNVKHQVLEDYLENSVIISWNPNFKTAGASHAILFTVMVLKKEFIQIQADFFYLS